MKITVLESLFNKVSGLMACNFIKKRLQDRCFPVNIATFLRTAFFYRAPLVDASEYGQHNTDRQSQTPYFHLNYKFKLVFNLATSSKSTLKHVVKSKLSQHSNNFLDNSFFYVLKNH